MFLMKFVSHFDNFRFYIYVHVSLPFKYMAVKHVTQMDIVAEKIQNNNKYYQE